MYRMKDSFKCNRLRRGKRTAKPSAADVTRVKPNNNSNKTDHHKTLQTDML